MIKWVVRIALLCALCGAVAAQGTGGSMGGGSWGGGGGGGGGGGYSSSSSSSSSSDYSYSGGGYSSSSSGDGDPTVAVIFIGLGIVVWIIIAIAKASSALPPIIDDGSYSIVGDSVDVRVLRVAIDGRARKFVQSELARIASSPTRRHPEGRVTMLREVTLTLRRLRDAWVYGGAVNEPMRADELAEGNVRSLLQRRARPVSRGDRPQRARRQDRDAGRRRTRRGPKKAPA